MAAAMRARSCARSWHAPARAGLWLLLTWQAAVASAEAQLTASLLREAASEREWSPRGVLAARDGKLYVVAAGDGAKAIVFSLSRCGEFVPLIAFDDGRRLQHGLSEGGDGTLHGVWYGGPSGTSTEGGLFSLTGTGRYQVRHAFDGGDGANPSGPPAVDAAGAIYGVTLYGGTARDGGAGFGTVYRRDPAGTLTTLVDFGQLDGAQTGLHPASRLALADDGTLYGTTSLGGPHGGGTVFRLRPAGATYTFERVAAFGGDAAAGTTPHDLLLARDGNLYGRAYAGQGVIFRVTPQGELSVLHALREAEGEFGGAPALPLPVPSGSLIEGADGALYGVAYGGGEAQQGTLYAPQRDGTLVVLHAFSGRAEGGHPTSIAQASDGRFFGGVERGGSGGRGGIYELAPASFDRARSACAPSEFVPSSELPSPARMLDGGFVARLPTADAGTSPHDAGSISSESVQPDASSASTPHASVVSDEDGPQGDGGCALTPVRSAKGAQRSALSPLVCAVLVALLSRRRRVCGR